MVRRTLRALKALAKRLLRYEHWPWVKARIRRERDVKRTVLSFHGTLSSKPKRVCLFASWDEDSIIDALVYEQLTAYSRKGLEIVFISSSSKLHPRDKTKLQELCAAIIHRTNRGHDFASWACAFRLFPQLFQADAILFTNDSILGPFHEMDFIENLDSLDLDVVGLTDSWELQYHLQSYFLYCRKSAIESEAYREFWRDIEALPVKDAIISCYEIGFSQKMIAADLRIGALHKYQDLLAQALGDPEFEFRYEVTQKPRNPSLYFWNYLLASGSFPFLKRELFSLNSTRSGRIHQWRKECEKWPRMVDLVTASLRRRRNIHAI